MIVDSFEVKEIVEPKDNELSDRVEKSYETLQQLIQKVDSYRKETMSILKEYATKYDTIEQLDKDCSEVLSAVEESNTPQEISEELNLGNGITWNTDEVGNVLDKFTQYSVSLETELPSLTKKLQDSTRGIEILQTNMDYSASSSDSNESLFVSLEASRKKKKSTPEKKRKERTDKGASKKQKR